MAGYIHAKSGNKAQALRIITDLAEHGKSTFVAPEAFALIYTGLDDKDQAIAWLRKSCSQSSLNVQVIKVDPMFDGLRSDPRFADIVRCVGLTP